MRIWQLQADVESFDWLEPVKWPGPDYIQTFNGSSKIDTWVPMKVKRMQPELNLELSDLPNMFITVFSQRAVDVLYSYIKEVVELLPLDYAEQQFYAINITAVMDVIDYDASIYKTFRDGKRIMKFDKYVFRKCDALLQHDIFKIIDEPLSWPFVTDRFKNQVEVNRLTGFVFKLVWDSES